MRIQNGPSTMGTMDTSRSMPAFRQPTTIERAFNRFFGFLVGLGLGMRHNYLLEVRGRKSGRLYSTPIDLLEIGGKRFLVAPRGRTQWVRNAEAAGEVTLKKGSFRQSFHLRAIPDSDKPKYLKAYLDSFQDHGAAILPCSCGLGGTGVCQRRGELFGVLAGRAVSICNEGRHGATLPRRLFQEVHVRAVDLAGGSRHADLAGAAAGVALIRLLRFHFRRLMLGRRLGQFWEQEAAIAGEAAATCVHRNRDFFAAGASNSFQLLYDSHLRHRAYRMQRNRTGLRLDCQLG